MKRAVRIAIIAGIAFAYAASASVAADRKGKTGEDLFKEHCALCHPDGGNIVNPEKTLHKAQREKNGIKTAADILRVMRNPGPGMQKFDEKTLPDRDARQIAEYILKTFK